MIASAAGSSAQGVCPMDCRRDRFSLVDASGQHHRIECDRRCRNHLYATADACLLPSLAAVARSEVSAVRIEGQLDSAGVVAAVVSVYRAAIDSLRDGLPVNVPEALATLRSATDRPLSNELFLRCQGGLKPKEVTSLATADHQP